MRRGILALGLVVALAATSWPAAPPVKGSRGFTKEQADWLKRTQREADEHGYAGRFEQAEQLTRQCVELLQRVLGSRHWQTQDGRLRVEVWVRLTRVPARQRPDVGRSLALDAQGQQRTAAGRYAEALKLLREALAIRQKALGESHPSTATSTNNVALCLQALGKPSEALPLFQKALAIREKALGESHPDTA